MDTAKRRPAPFTATMREFRAAPAKMLRRAARTGVPLCLGGFVLSVREDVPTGATVYGAMAKTARVTGQPSSILSAEDEWPDDLPSEEEAPRGDR